MKRYKTAVIGSGFIGAAHVEALRRLGNVDIVALCDVNNAAERAEEFNIPKSYSDYREMLQNEQLDVLHVCTPNNTHYSIVKAAVERGVNFICEKPFTITAEQAAELSMLCAAKGVQGAVNFHNRFYPMAREMREKINAGELGDIFTVHGEYIQDWLLYDTDYSWRLSSEMAGLTRAISDIGSHWLDLVEFVTGAKITKVCARMKTVYSVRKKPLGNVTTFATGSGSEYESINIDTEDAAMVLAEFDNGSIGSLVVSQVFAGKKNTMTLSVAGSKSSVVWNTEALNDLYIGHRNSANELLAKDASLVHGSARGLISYPGGHIEGFPDAFKQMFRNFYSCLESGKQGDWATPEDCLHDILVCNAIYESNKTGSWISVRENTK